MSVLCVVKVSMLKAICCVIYARYMTAQSALPQSSELHLIIQPTIGATSIDTGIYPATVQQPFQGRIQNQSKLYPINQLNFFISNSLQFRYCLGDVINIIKQVLRTIMLTFLWSLNLNDENSWNYTFRNIQIISSMLYIIFINESSIHVIFFTYNFQVFAPSCLIKRFM